MKYIKTYNEKLGDKLTAPNDDDIWNKISKFSDDYILEKSLKEKYLFGVKKIIDKILTTYKEYSKIDYISRKIINENLFSTSNEIIKYLFSIDEIKDIFNEKQIYLIEKYILNMHQNELKDFEKIIIERLKDLDIKDYIDSDNLLNKIFYKDNKVYFVYTPISEYIDVNYELWKYYTKFLKLNDNELSFLLNKLIPIYLKLNIKDIFNYISLTNTDKIIKKII